MGDARKSLSSDEASRNFGDVPATEDTDDIYEEYEDTEEKSELSDDYVVGIKESKEDERTERLLLLSLFTFPEVKKYYYLLEFYERYAGQPPKASPEIKKRLCEAYYNSYDELEKFKKMVLDLRNSGIQLMGLGLVLTDDICRGFCFVRGAELIAASQWIDFSWDMYCSRARVRGYEIFPFTQEDRIRRTVKEMEDYKKEMKKFDETVVPALQTCGLFKDGNKIAPIVMSYLIKDQDEEIVDVVLYKSRTSSLPLSRR